MQKQGQESGTISPVRIEGDYNANPSLRVLKGLEAVRERPGMYVGDTNVRGLHHLFTEIMDNAINEVMAGHCTKINVVYAPDNSVSVEDNGCGIPVEVIEGTGKTGVELVMTSLHAGDKISLGGYKVSGGLHGVGASCVNALSTWLECEVRMDGKIHRQRFERGIPTGLLAVVGDCGKEEHGTRITWLADDTIFTHALDENGNLNYDPERFRTRLRELAYLNKEATLSFQDAHRRGEPDIFQYPRGIANYAAFLNEGKGVLHGEVIYQISPECPAACGVG